MLATRQAPTGGPAPHAPFFPFARYTSLVGVHTSLVLFVALFLPRTSLSDVLPASLVYLFPDVTQPAYTRGGDHPQSRFMETLTASPTSTVAWICVGVGILQVWWAGWVRGWLVEYQASKLGAVTGDQEKDNENVTFSRFVDASAFTIMVTVVLYCGLFIGGAPLTSHMPHTFLLALLISILVIYPASFVYGPPVPVLSLISSSAPSHSYLHRQLPWLRIFAELSPQSEIDVAILHPALGTLLGAWTGMIPLGLDWERAWQQWPLPPAYGAITGAVLGSLVGCAWNGFQQLVKEGRARAAGAVAARNAEVDSETPKKQGKKGKKGERVQVKMTGDQVEKFEGNEAVEQMRRSVQSVLTGMGVKRKDEEGSKKDEDEAATDAAASTASKKARKRQRGKGIAAKVES